MAVGRDGKEARRDNKGPGGTQGTSSDRWERNDRWEGRRIKDGTGSNTVVIPRRTVGGRFRRTSRQYRVGTAQVALTMVGYRYIKLFSNFTHKDYLQKKIRITNL